MDNSNDEIEECENGDGGPEIFMMEDDELLDELDENNEVHQADDSIARICAHEKDIFCLAISPNGRYIASGSEDDTVAIWNLKDESETQKPQIHIKGKHADSVHCLAWNVNASLLASGDMAGRILCVPSPTSIEKADDSILMIEDCQIDVSRLCQENAEENSFEQIRWIFWHTSVEGILFAGCGDGSIWMWLISRQQQKINVNQSKIFTTHSNAPCVSGQLLLDAKHLIAAYEDSFIRLWYLKEANSIEIKLPEQCTGAMDVKEKAALIAIGCANGVTALASTGSCNLKLQHIFQSSLNEEKSDNNGGEEKKENSIECVRFAPSDLPWLAVGTSNGDLSIFDYERRSIRYQCGNDGEAIVDCIWRLGPDNSISLISASVDSGIRIWDAKSGEPLKIFSGGGDEIFSLVKWDDVDNNRVLLFTGCSAGFIRIFELSSNI